MTLIRFCECRKLHPRSSAALDTLRAIAIVYAALWSVMLRFAYLAVSHAFAALRLLALSDLLPSTDDATVAPWTCGDRSWDYYCTMEELLRGSPLPTRPAFGDWQAWCAAGPDAITHNDGVELDILMALYQRSVDAARSGDTAPRIMLSTGSVVMSDLATTGP